VTDLSGVKVAVYSGGPFEAGNNSRIALMHMFEWMSATVELIDPEEICSGALSDYDILAVPGIPAGNTYVELLEEGMNQIRQFVANGGSYIGICGGSMFGLDGYLGLFNGTLRTQIPGIAPGIHLITMTVNHESTGPDLSELPQTYSVLYWGSGYWDAEDMSGITTVMSYPENDRPGMIASRYGYGTYFLSSPHPEWEEGGPRDGTEYFDEFNDSDSEWPLMLSVARWLVDASPAPPPGPDLGLIGIAVAGVTISVIAVAAMVVILKRR
jgi:glutamine amidotransferase-like uncharacterized protein